MANFRSSLPLSLSKFPFKAAGLDPVSAWIVPAGTPRSWERDVPQQLGAIGKEFRDGKAGMKDGRMQVKQLQLWKIPDESTKTPHAGFRRLWDAGRIPIPAPWLCKSTENVLEHLCQVLWGALTGKSLDEHLWVHHQWLLLESHLWVFHQWMDVLEGAWTPLVSFGNSSKWTSTDHQWVKASPGSIHGFLGRDGCV